MAEMLGTGMAIASACRIADSLCNDSGALAMVIQEAKKAADVVDRATLPGNEGYELKSAVRAFCESATKLEMAAPAFVQKWKEVDTFMTGLRTRSHSEMSPDLARQAVAPLQELTSMALEIAKETDGLMKNLNKAQESSQRLLEAAAKEQEERSSVTGRIGSLFKGPSMLDMIGTSITSLLFFAGGAFLCGFGAGVLATLAAAMVPASWLGAALFVGAAILTGGVSLLVGIALSATALARVSSIFPVIEFGGKQLYVLDHDQLRGLLHGIETSTQELRDIAESLATTRSSANFHAAEVRFLQEGVTAGLNSASLMDENEQLRRKLQELMASRAAQSK